jgi:hypothetical protein
MNMASFPSIPLVMTHVMGEKVEVSENTIFESNGFMTHQGLDGLHNFGVHLKTNDPVNPDMFVKVLPNWIP